MKFSVNQIFGCVVCLILYMIWVVFIVGVDINNLNKLRDKMLIQVSLLDGEEIKDNINKKRIEFIGFYVTKDEKKRVIKMAKDTNTNVSDLCRYSLHLDPVKDDLNK